MGVTRQRRTPVWEEPVARVPSSGSKPRRCTFSTSSVPTFSPAETSQTTGGRAARELTRTFASGLKARAAISAGWPSAGASIPRRPARPRCRSAKAIRSPSKASASVRWSRSWREVLRAGRQVAHHDDTLDDARAGSAHMGQLNRPSRLKATARPRPPPGSVNRAITLLGARVPQGDRAVFARGGQPGAVGAEGHAEDRRALGVELDAAPARRRHALQASPGLRLGIQPVRRHRQQPRQVGIGAQQRPGQQRDLAGGRGDLLDSPASSASCSATTPPVTASRKSTAIPASRRCSRRCACAVSRSACSSPVAGGQERQSRRR